MIVLMLMVNYRIMARYEVVLELRATAIKLTIHSPLSEEKTPSSIQTPTKNGNNEQQ